MSGSAVSPPPQSPSLAGRSSAITPAHLPAAAQVERCRHQPRGWPAGQPTTASKAIQVRVWPLAGTFHRMVDVVVGNRLRDPISWVRGRLGCHLPTGSELWMQSRRVAVPQSRRPAVSRRPHVRRSPNYERGASRYWWVASLMPTGIGPFRPGVSTGTVQSEGGLTVLMVERGGDHVGPGRLCFIPLGQWALLRRAPHVIGYVLFVDLAAVALTVVSLRRMEPTPTQWWQFVVLGACGVVYTELTRRIERARYNFGASPHVNMESVWTFAAVLLLPAGLTAVIIAVVTAQRWFRVRHHVAHHQAFSAAAVILAAHAVAAVFGEFGFDPAERTSTYFI